MNETIQMAGNLDYANQTTINTVGLLSVIVLGFCVLLVPRRWAIAPLLILACFIPSAQRIVIFGLDFNFLRMLVIFGIVRLIVRKESHSFVWKPLDKYVTLWAISSIIIYTFQQGTISGFVNRLGFGFDAFGMYYLFRCLIRDWPDIDQIVFSIIMISIPVAILFLLENRTGRNLFSVFGGVPEITVIRDGRLRCQGAFPHPILAGCFWAALMPLFAALWWKSSKDKGWALVGLTMASIIVICSSSSTPIMGVLCGVIGGLMFFARQYMRQVRWGILLTLVTLHIVMKAPVWHLISRISAVGGSTGWHRYYLIDQAIRHFGEWWLLGTPSTAHWGLGLVDVTNQYILEGVRGGILTLIFFVIGIGLAFRAVGRLWRHNSEPYRVALSWCLGVSLFVHCMNFIGVSYFGQVHIIWYLLLAMIGSMVPAGQVVPVVRAMPRLSKMKTQFPILR